MNSKKQYDEAVRLAEELKRKCDALMGEGWLNNPILIVLHDYKREVVPQLEEAMAESAWPIELDGFIPLIGSIPDRTEEIKQLRDLWDKMGFEDAWLEGAIDASKHDRTVWDGLLAIATYALRAYALGGRQVPVFLANFQADVNEGSPGPTSRTNTKRRQELLAYMVDFVSVKAEIPPTRNEYSTRDKDAHERSACDAVAAAVFFSYHRVLQAWQGGHSYLPSVPDPDRTAYVTWGDGWITAIPEEHKSRSELLSELEGLDRDPFEQVEDFDP